MKSSHQTRRFPPPWQVDQGNDCFRVYDSTLSFLEDAIFGDQEKSRKAILDKIVYAKTREWEYEREYRLAIPIHADGHDWNTLSYQPEEITEL